MTHTPTNHDPTDERHRTGCADCAAVWDDLERISAQAAALPALTPSRDLWRGIEARLADSSLPDASTPDSTAAGQSFPHPARTRRAWYGGPAVRLAIAASLLVAVTSAVTWQLATAGHGTPPLTPLTSASPEESALHVASFTETVSSMEREISALQTIVRDRRSELDPQTVIVLEENLSLIDRAIAESRAALASDPASQFLAAQFTRAYSSKLTLLRDAATLPIGI
jgi:hypothetical protein